MLGLPVVDRPRIVAARVGQVDRGVLCVGIRVETLPIGRRDAPGVTLEERAGGGVVGAGPEELEPGLGVGAFAGEADLVGEGAGLRAGRAKRGIGVGRGGVARGVGDEPDRALSTGR